MDEGRDVCKVCGKARDEHYMAMVAGVPVAGSYEPDGNTPLYCSQVALQAQNAALMAVLSGLGEKALQLADLTLYDYDSKGGRWDNPRSDDLSRSIAAWIMGAVPKQEAQP